MKFFYDSLEDIVRRLAGTVVADVEGNPVLIHAVAGLNTDQMVDFFTLPLKTYDNRTPERAPLTKERFEIRRLPTLGYTDYGKDDAVYIQRVPIRGNKQGYCRENTRLSNRGVTFQNLINDKGFVQMFKGKYKPFKQVIENVVEADIDDETPRYARSVNKVFAISGDDLGHISLFHRGVRIGRCMKPKKAAVFVVADQFAYLKETLEEAGIKVEAA